MERAMSELVLLVQPDDVGVVQPVVASLDTLQVQPGCRGSNTCANVKAVDWMQGRARFNRGDSRLCLLYTSDAADE